jgi:hypothetical protein
LGGKKTRLYARAKWHFGDGRTYCNGCGGTQNLCPFHKCQYTETTLETDVGYQAWEILLKLSKPDLGLALEVARNLGFDMELMSELLPVGISGRVYVENKSLD